jgi:hypothetical protein
MSTYREAYEILRYNSQLFDKILQLLLSTTVEYSRFVEPPSDICHQMSYKRYNMKLFVELSRTSLCGIYNRENLFSIAFFSDLRPTAYLIFIFCQAALLGAAYTLLYAISQKRYIFLKKNFLSTVNSSNSNGWTSIKFFECRILPVKNLTTDKLLQTLKFQRFSAAGHFLSLNFLESL